jgi:hypothetical protein
MGIPPVKSPLPIRGGLSNRACSATRLRFGRHPRETADYHSVTQANVLARQETLE